ncbi:hypothetical protein FG386_002131 [Cryptosporidium ryanae]|uniref:uncharacterized protein n=1 Tax=Cryptosporidium ryanae TaxID=515981 RepID=UPI00351A615A|nr:hypothetical protein FG386_002131 [Cryptosporidium ryanae]
MAELPYSNNINNKVGSSSIANNNYIHSGSNSSGFVNGGNLTPSLDRVSAHEYYKFLNMNSNNRIGEGNQTYDGARNLNVPVGIGNLNSNANTNSGNNINNIKNQNVVLFNGGVGYESGTVNNNIRGGNLQTEKNIKNTIDVSFNKPYYISQYQDQHIIQPQTQALPQSRFIPNPNNSSNSGHVISHMGASSKNIYDVHHMSQSINNVTNTSISNGSNAGNMDSKINGINIGNNINSIPNYLSSNNSNMVNSYYASKQYAGQGCDVNAFNNAYSQSQIKHITQTQSQNQSLPQSQSYSQPYSQPYSHSQSHSYSQHGVQPHLQTHYQISSQPYSQSRPQSHSQSYSRSNPQSYSQQYSQSQVQIPQTQFSQEISQSKSSYYHPNNQLNSLQYQTVQSQTQPQPSQTHRQNQIYQNTCVPNNINGVKPCSYSEMPITQGIASRNTYVNPTGSQPSSTSLQTVSGSQVELVDSLRTKSKTRNNDQARRNMRATQKSSEVSHTSKTKPKVRYQSKSKDGVRPKNLKIDSNIGYGGGIRVKDEVEFRTDTVNLGITTFQVEVPSNISDELMNSIVRVIPREHINSILLLVSSLISKKIKVNEFHGHLMSMLKGSQLVEILEKILKEHFLSNNPDLLRSFSSSLVSREKVGYNHEINGSADSDLFRNKDNGFFDRYFNDLNRIDNTAGDNYDKHSNLLRQGLTNSLNSPNSSILQSSLLSSSVAVDGARIKSQTQGNTQSSSYGKFSPIKMLENGSQSSLMSSQLTSRKSISRHGGHYNMHTKEEVLLQMLRHSRKRCSAGIMSLYITGPCTNLSKMLPNNFGTSCKIGGEEAIKKDTFSLFYKRLNDYGNYLRSTDNMLGLEVISSKYDDNSDIDIGKTVRFLSRKNKSNNSTSNLQFSTHDENSPQRKTSFSENLNEIPMFSENTVKTVYKLAGFYVKDIIKHILEEEKINKARNKMLLNYKCNSNCGSDIGTNNSIENSEFGDHHSSKKADEDEYTINVECEDSIVEDVKRKTGVGNITSKNVCGTEDNYKEIKMEYDSFTDQISFGTNEKGTLNKGIENGDMDGRGKGLDTT